MCVRECAKKKETAVVPRRTGRVGMNRRRAATEHVFRLFTPSFSLPASYGNGSDRFPETLIFVGLAFKLPAFTAATSRDGYDGFVPVDAVYALPVPLVEQLGLKSEMREPRPLPPGATPAT